MKITEFIKIMWKEEIARRYFVMNSFDGTLTVLGIIIAEFLTGIHDSIIVIISCSGAAVAMGISGFWGAYSAEIAERKKALKELESQMLTDLKNTNIGRSVERMSILIAIVDGIAPTLAAIILIIPFIFSEIAIISINYAFYMSFFLVSVILFSVGIFTGYIAEENRLRSGIRMFLAGVLVAIIILMIDGIRNML